MRQPVLVRERGEKALGEERKGIELVAANGQGEESDVYSAGAETLQQHGSDFFDHCHLNLWELPREQREMRWKEIRRDSRYNPDTKRATNGILALPYVALGGFQFAEDSTGAWKKSFAEIGETNGTPKSVEQARAKFVFEFEDLLRKRWLGDMGLLGRAAE